MFLRELTEGALAVWSRDGGKSVRKYRCTTGPRKGQVRAEPASCNKAFDLAKSISLKKTKSAKGAKIHMTGVITRKGNAASRRLPRIQRRVKARKRSKIK
jgi:hypothetical protein